MAALSSTIYNQTKGLGALVNKTNNRSNRSSHCTSAVAAVQQEYSDEQLNEIFAVYDSLRKSISTVGAIDAVRSKTTYGVNEAYKVGDADDEDAYMDSDDNMETDAGELGHEVESDVDLDGLDPLNVDEYQQSSTDDICSHDETTQESNVEVCNKCGIELKQILSFEQEWRFYGDGDSKNRTDPSRCQYRKVEDKNIFKDLEKRNLFLPKYIALDVNRLYLTVTDGEIKRGKARGRIIYACIKGSLNNNGVPEPEDLDEKFNLTKKEKSKGMTYYNLRIPKDQRSTVYTSPIHFISRIMKQFSSSEYHVSRVNELYGKIYNRSRLLNSSNPMSSAAGLIYFYCRLIGKDITCSRFSKLVSLSEITCSRIAREICKILQVQNKVRLS